ncbi:hypothetical protein KCU95_g3682, partial [Aureobasidium melanogenum]
MPSLEFELPYGRSRSEALTSSIHLPPYVQKSFAIAKLEHAEVEITELTKQANDLEDQLAELQHAITQLRGAQQQPPAPPSHRGRASRRQETDQEHRFYGTGPGAGDPSDAAADAWGTNGSTPAAADAWDA